MEYASFKLTGSTACSYKQPVAKESEKEIYIKEPRKAVFTVLIKKTF